MGERKIRWTSHQHCSRPSDMGNKRSKPAKLPAPESSEHKELQGYESQRQQAAAIMTSRRTRAETLGKMLTRDRRVLTQDPSDYDSYLLWRSHFPLEGVLKKADLLLCSDPDLAYSYKMVVPTEATPEQFWSRYFYAQNKIHEDEQMLEAPQRWGNNSTNAGGEDLDSPGSSGAGNAALCGRVKLGAGDTLEASIAA